MAAYFRFLLDNPQVVRMIRWMRLEGRSRVRRSGHDLRARGLQLIGAAQAAGSSATTCPPSTCC
ncbi:MAG: hypothetical protein U0168_00750 [Nannocystaceae bacterium]